MATAVSGLSTFETVRRQVQLLTGNRLDPARAGVLINLTLASLWDDHSWSAKKVDTTLTLVAPKDGGSVSLNTDHRLIDGTDTSFMPSDIGAFIRVGASVPFYRVSGVTGQQLRLETPYAEGAFLNESYVVFRHIYQLPLDFKAFLTGSYWDALHQVTQQRLDIMDPLRLTMDATPRLYALRGIDVRGHPIIEIWPVPSAALLIRYTYLRTIGPYGPLDGDEVVPLRGDLVAYATAGEALMALAVDPAHEKQAQVLIAVADRHMARAVVIREDALRADLNIFGVPESVPGYQGVAHGADYLARHDDAPVA